MRLSLLITTYDRPEALERTLQTVLWQRSTPDEVVVADDGSAAATANLIDSFRPPLGVPLRHIWQNHEGFRAGRIRNLAIARSDADYVVLIDGDMLLHPDFVADHRQFARRGSYVQGTRIHLGEQATREVLLGSLRIPGPFSPDIGWLRRAYAIRAMRLARVTERLANRFVAVKSCNQGFWREDLLRVNGFDETMIGWGFEDKELCARLQHCGVERRTLLFGGIAGHLYHARAARDRADINRAIYETTLREGRVRAGRGIDGHAC